MKVTRIVQLALLPIAMMNGVIYFHLWISGENSNVMPLILLNFLVLGGMSLLVLRGQSHQEILRRNSEKCEAILSAVELHDIVAITDLDGIILDVNQNFCNISGYDRDELIGQSHSILNSEVHSKAFFQHLWDTIKAGKSWKGIICNRAKDGTLYWVDSVIVPRRSKESGEVIGYLSIRHEVTQRVRLFEEGNRNKKRLEALIEYSPIGVVETDADGKILLVNKSFCLNLGYQEEELLGRFLPAFIHPEDASMDEELKNSILDEDGRLQKMRKRYLKKDGSALWTRVSSNRLPSGCMINTIENIQPLYEREVALQKYYEQFEKIFSLSSDIISISAMDGRVIHANESCYQYLLRGHAELNSFSIIDRIHPDDKGLTKRHWQFLREGISTQWEARMRTTTGDYKLILWNAVPDTVNGLVYSIGRDISELRQAEIKVMNASKMLSLSQISSGVAHEINNPLTIIRGRVELIKKHLTRENPDLNKIKKYLENTDEMVTRISSIIDALRIFSNTSVHSSGPFLEEAWALPTLEQAVFMFHERLHKKGIRLEIVLKGDDFKFYCRTREIIHIISILLANSIEAIQKIPDRWISIELINEIEQAVIVIKDSGYGIGENVRDRIMEPFFTTKVQSTGLGLSVAKGLIAGHGGWLDLDKTQANTTFVLKIPHPQMQKTIEVIRSAS